MKATFVRTKKGTMAYIQRTYRKDGVPTSETVRRLGSLEDIRETHGCEDPVKWVRELAERMTQEERDSAAHVTVEFSPNEEVEMDRLPLRHGGDILMWHVYNMLGLPELCAGVMGGSKAMYDLDEILRTLVFSRVLCPCSKIRSLEFARGFIHPPRFSENDMYRSLTLLASHINDIQAGMYKASKEFICRREKVLYYDCTNYFFETEDNDADSVDEDSGEVVAGLRKRGKSKENRTSPIVQMGMFMDADGIPLAFIIFPGNESEQVWLQPLEKILGGKFDITEFVVSTDSGLASEENRRYNMAEGRDYICVQSLPGLRETDQEMALAPAGWRVAYCEGDGRVDRLPTEDPDGVVFDLGELLEAEVRSPGLIRGITFYREIIVEKILRYDNPTWLEMERKDRGGRHLDKDGKPVPRQLSTPPRNERVIVTYNHDYALFLRHRRSERLRVAEAIVRNGDADGRHSRQSVRRFITTLHMTKDGESATKVQMAIDEKAVEQDARFDGYYAYGTSLDDDAVDVLRARSFHHEIEHLFRTTKTFLKSRPVYLSDPDRIRSHFLTCFIAMTILKVMQKLLSEKFADSYRDEPLSIDRLIGTLRSFRFYDQRGRGYSPAYIRTQLTDQLQELAGIKVNTQIIKPKTIKEIYRKCKQL